MQYLEEYLDTIVSLPNDLQRHYSLLKQLESSSSSNLISSLTRQVDAIVEGKGKKPSSSPSKLSKATSTDDLKGILLKQIGVAQQRLAIAKSAQASVEVHVQRLDDDLKHFEEEARLAGITLPRSQPKSANPTTAGSVHSVSASNMMHRKRREGSGSRERHSSKKKTRRRHKEDSGASEASNNSDIPNAASHRTTNAHKKLSKRRKRVHTPPTTDGIYCFCEGPPQMVKTDAGEVVHNMIACDYGRCPYEWFHLECVGEKDAEKGEPWYCPECRDKASRRHHQ